MNTVGPGLIDAVLKASISADLVSLIGDTDVSPTTVTISTPSGAPVVDDAAGTYTRSTDDDSVSALRCEVNLDDVAASAGRLQTGDIRYHVMASALSSTPTTETVVVDGSDRLQTIHVSQDPLQVMWTLTARRLP